jgi:hypothetical protein
LQSGLPFTTVFVSEVSWFDLKPPYGAAIDPFLISFSQLSSRGERPLILTPPAAHH